MSAHHQIRFASLTSAAYGALLASGILHHFQRTGSFRALAHGLSQPLMWISLLVVALVAFGLWRRQAWSWWLGVAAAAFQSFRILAAWFDRGIAQAPGVSGLIALALLLLLLALLLPRRARLACNR
jgi:hydrogenase/urease accessory protein HupE